MYAIEKNIPLPGKIRSRRAPYPFRDLEIGDSFLIPLQKDKSPSSIYAAVSAAKSRFGINLTTSKVEGGIRVWRIGLQSTPAAHP